MKEIATALAKAQAEMKNPKFDSQNPHFRNRYASLAAVRDAVVPILAKHGITITQDLATCEGRVSCRTVMTHSSGEQMTFGPLELPATKQDAQGFGSAFTYARRYSLMAACSVVGDDDDDANAASQPNGTTTDPKGEDWKKVDTRVLNKYLGQLADAFKRDPVDELAIHQLMGELAADNEMKVAVWAHLQGWQKDMIRSLAERKVA